MLSEQCSVRNTVQIYLIVSQGQAQCLDIMSIFNRIKIREVDPILVQPLAAFQHYILVQAGKLFRGQISFQIVQDKLVIFFAIQVGLRIKRAALVKQHNIPVGADAAG